MNPEKEKAPEGAQMMTNPDTGIPESQGFLEAKEWLASSAFKRAADDPYVDFLFWEPEDQQAYVDAVWNALVIIHGEENARMLLLTKHSDVVKGVRNG